MKTPHTVFQNRTLKQSRIFVVLLIAAALIIINVVPSNAGATTTTPQTEVALDPATAPFLQGTLQTVGKTSGAQGQPSSSGNIVAYTDFDESFLTGRIRYFDFATNTDHLIPGPDTDNYSNYSDVSGHSIVFQEVTPGSSRLVLFDTVSKTRSVFGRSGGYQPVIGGNLVVYSFRRENSGSPTEIELETFDLTTSTTTELTNDHLLDYGPHVSPTGSAVVVNKCQYSAFDCDVYAAFQTAPGVFTTTALTNAGLNDRDPVTNGETVVYVKYDSSFTEPSDIYFQPLTGGEETRLAMPSHQHRPRIAGNLIAFESLEPVPGAPWVAQTDIFVYDISTQTLSRVTDTPYSDFIGDFSIANGSARIVFTGVSNPDSENASQDIFAFTFLVPNTVEDQIRDLIELVESFGLPRGSENSLTTKLQTALAALEASDTATACDSLRAFINECQAQSGKKLTAAQATQLINSANLIKTDLGCQ
jgi:Tol biopolymer transport system component